MNKTTENIQIDLFKRADDLTSSINNAIAALQKADGAKAKVEIEAEIKGQKEISKLQEELNELVNKKNELELQIKVDTDKVAKGNIEKLIKPLESEINKINKKITDEIDAMFIKGFNAFHELDSYGRLQAYFGAGDQVFDTQTEGITKLLKKIAELNQYYKALGKNLPTKYEDMVLELGGSFVYGEHFKDFEKSMTSGKEVGRMVVTQEYNAVTSKDSEKALGGLERQINGLQKKLESLLSNELSRIQKALSNENIDADGLNTLSDRLGVIQDISVDFGFEKQRDSALDLIDAVNDVYDRIEVNPNQNNLSLAKSSPTQTFDNEIQQNLVMLENYKNTIAEIDRLKLEPETDETKHKIEELNKLADYFAAKITTIQSENGHEINRSMMQFNGTWNENLRSHYTEEQRRDFWKIAGERSGLNRDTVLTEFSGISEELERIEEKSNKLASTYAKDVTESRSYVSRLKADLVNLVDTQEELANTSPKSKDYALYTKDLDVFSKRSPEVLQFLDKLKTYEQANEFVKTDEWVDFLATLPKAHDYLESIGYDFERLSQQSNETPVSTDDSYVENHIEKLKQEEHQANETAIAENDLQQSRQGSLDSQLSNISNIDELNNYIRTIDIAKSSAEELQSIVSKSQSIGGYWDLDPDALMGIVNRFEELGYALDDTGQNFIKVSQGIQTETEELREEAQQAHVTAEAEHEVAEARQELVSPVNDVAEEPIIEGQNQIQAEFEETSEAGVAALTTIRQEAINTEQMLRNLFNQLFGLTAEQSIMRGLNSQDIIDLPDSQVKITDINNEATARQRNAEATREETKAQQEYNQAQQTHVNYGDYAETENLSNLLSLVIAITQAVREKTEAFAQEDLLVSQAINNENGELSLLLQTLQQIKSIVKEIKIPNGGKLGWLKELSNADADKLSSVSENLKKIYDGVKKLDVKDSNFISQINTILNKGKELENLAKVLSSTKKDINDTAKATKSNKQTESKKTYDAELANRKKILDLEYKIAKAEAEGDNGDLAEKRYRPEIRALERIVDAEKKKRQEQKLTSREYRNNIEHELSVIEQKQKAEIKGIRAVTAERNRQAQQQSLVGNIDQQLKDLEKARKSIDDLLNQKQSGLHPNYVQDAKDKVKELEEQIKKLKKMRVDIVDAKDLSELEEAQKLTEDLVDGAKKVKASATDSANKLAKDIKIQNLNEEITDFLTKNTKLSAEFRAELDALRKKLSGDNLSNQDILDIASAFAKVKASAKEAGDVGKSAIDTIKQRLSDMNAKFFAQFVSFQDIIRYGRQIFSVIQQLDTALVDLRKTTTMNNEDLNEFYSNSNKIAIQLGTTTEQIISQAAAWSRLGYSTKEEAESMAALSSQFAAISPGMSLEQATDGLVSTMKGFGIAVEDTERTIMDNVNRIGRNMPKHTVMYGVTYVA